MSKDPKVLEEKAYEFLATEKFYDAFLRYQEAAKIYRSQNRHKQAALCFASAASCWGKKSGEAAFYNAALAYQAAAAEAVKVGDLEYASLLYKYAAINFERDREFANFSESFFMSKEYYRKFVACRLINPKKINAIVKSRERISLRVMFKLIFNWFGLTLSSLVWGHGERPVRTFYSGILIIVLCAFIYTTGYVMQGGDVIKPGFWQAAYFSVITFTTVGYGDITPIGFTKAVVSFESVVGIFIIPMFVISLSRKYLRE